VCRELLRYREFLGIQREQAAIAEAQKALKMKGDFTAPTSLAAIEETRTQGTPADR
jgi:hypothetical protein